jgi:hypothetical protein
MVYGIVLPTLVIKIELIWRSHGIKKTLFIGSSWDRVAIMDISWNQLAIFHGIYKQQKTRFGLV